MNLYYYFGLTITAMIAGLSAGTIGAGAEIIIVPLLTFFGILGPLKKRIGTSLFMLLPPIGIGATLKYYNAGYVEIYSALYMSLIFTLFASVSSEYSIPMDSEILRKIFGIYTILCGIYIFMNHKI